MNKVLIILRYDYVLVVLLSVPVVNFVSDFRALYRLSNAQYPTE